MVVRFLPETCHIQKDSALHKYSKRNHGGRNIEWRANSSWSNRVSLFPHWISGVSKGCCVQTTEGSLRGHVTWTHIVLRYNCFPGQTFQNIFLSLCGTAVLISSGMDKGKLSVFGLANRSSSRSFCLLTCSFWGQLSTPGSCSTPQQCCSVHPRLGQRRLPWQFTADESDLLPRQLPSALTGKWWVKAMS